MKKTFNYLLTGLLFGGIVVLSSCGDDEVPEMEDEEETITRITLTFTPEGGGETVTAVWFDADGDEGTTAPTKEDISLAANTEYDLNITLENTLATEADEMDITSEINGEGAEEHQLFFAWSGDIFSAPTGTGNVTPRSVDGSDRPAGATDGAVTYADLDGNDRPIGLMTTWTTAANATSGVFRVVLKHQPGESEDDPPLKSDTSTSDTGEDDFDLDFNVSIN